jgi:hypothetical protein
VLPIPAAGRTAPGLAAVVPPALLGGSADPIEEGAFSATSEAAFSATYEKASCACFGTRRRKKIA